MAYIAIDSLVNKLTEKLIEEEANLFHQVVDQVCSLLCMLKSLRPFVQEFHRKRTVNIQSSMKEFIKLVNEAEDAIDSYITTRGTEASEKDIEVDRQLRNKIEKIKSRLIKWHNSQHYLMASQAPNSIDKDDDAAPMGLDNKATMMMERLESKDKCPGRDVIPIVGPGGVGKTTLARRVYKDSTTLGNFDCRAWVDANIPSKELLQEIIKQVRTEALNRGDNDHSKPEKIILRELAIQLFDLLKKKRYLLVFDDVCKTQFWADVDMIFPNNNLGSRIIFTTRYDEVAESAKPRRRPVYLQPTLSKEQSLALFSSQIRISRSNAASTSSEGGGAPVVKSPWKECVEASGGLPSAILELAAEHDKLRMSGGNEEDVGEQTWKLIYNNLPHHLKPCFLYLGILSSCCYSQFIELMIAEEFVHGQQPLTTIAGKYLNEELLDRKLVEVVSKHLDGRIKQIGTPKWLNFSKSEGRKENLLEFWDAKKEADSWDKIPSANPEGGVMGQDKAERILISLPLEANRVAVQGLSKGVIGVINSALKELREAGTITSLSSLLSARSFLILPSEGEARDEIIIPWEFLDRNLRVLDVFLPELIEAIPGDIERLKLLRYLRLNYLVFKGETLLLPQTICNLWNLQFLRMKNRSPQYFSSEFKLEGFWRMRQLKHFLCSDILLLLPDSPEKDVVLKKLERLKHLYITCCTEANLSRFPNLVRLGIGGKIQPVHIQEILFNSLRQLTSLEKLSLHGAEDNEILPVPNLDLFPPSITHLTLKRTRLKGDIMRLLGKLPNLQVLKLAFKAIEEAVLDFTQKIHVPDMDTATAAATGYGFPKLKCLKLEEIDIIKWDQPEGAMPSLEIVVIRNCIHLHDLPLEALQKIQSLQVLELYKIHPAVKEVDIQKCIGKDGLQLRFTEQARETVN